MPHVAVNGARIYYEERGEGTPILGIHGTGSAAVFWEDAAQRLSDLGRVIVYDRRGSWRSEQPEPYELTSVAEHANDALALLQELDAVPAVLIGRSYGGTIALELALRHPESVLGIALLEAGPMGLSAAYDTWFGALCSKLDEIARAQGVERVGEAALREILGAWEELPETWREVFAANGQALLAEVRGEERVSDDLDIDALEVPALVVTAEASPEAIQQGSEALARTLPGARAVRVGGDHAIDPAGADVRVFISELFAR